MNENNIWVFGSHSGKDYADNSKALFEYASKQDKIRAVWLTRSDNILNRIRDLNYEVYKFYSLRGIYCALVSKCVILSYSYDDVSVFAYLLAKFKKIIQLFHGVPLKKLEIEASRGFLNKIIRKILWFIMGKRYDLIISTTPKVKNIFANFFKVKSDIVVTTGYPRNDILADNKIDLGMYSKLNFRENSKIILYMPTYRDYSQDDPNFNLFFKYKFDIQKLETILKNKKAELVIKLHHRDYKYVEKILTGLNQYERVHFISPKHGSIDTYNLVKIADILITDYSSIYFDYLLLNRPIIFSAFDKNEYENKDKGFYLNYDDVTPGKKCINWIEVFDEISDILSGKDYYKEARKKINILFNPYSDDRSAERVFKVISNL